MLTAVSRGKQEYSRNSQLQNTSVPRITEEYITQVSEEIECKFTKNLSQEFSRTKSRISGALSKLDKFFLNPHLPTLSGTIPGTSRRNSVENREPAGGRSHNDPHPEVVFSASQSSNSIDSDQEETSHRSGVEVFGMNPTLVILSMLPTSKCPSSFSEKFFQQSRVRLTNLDFLGSDSDTFLSVATGATHFH